MRKVKPMNNNNNAVKTSDEKSQEDAQKNSTATKKSFRWSILFIIITLLLASASFAGAAYMYLQFEQYKQQTNSSINHAMDKVNTFLQQKLGVKDLPQHITPLLTPLQLQLQSIEQANLKAQQARRSLTESTQKLFELYGRDQSGWQLAEVEYLLRIARHRLLIENDFRGAAQTLKAADEKLTEIADPGLLAVRLAISDERAVLQARKRPDLVAIVLSLSRIVKQIPLLDLSLNSTKDSTKILPMDAVTRDKNSPWRDQISQFMMGLVKVEPLKKSIATPVVTLINVVNTLEENLKLAKWAVLERDQQQYVRLIKQSNALFKQYFNANNKYHAEINAELERLLTLEIRPKLPDISNSLSLLKTIMAKKTHKVSSIREKAQTLPIATLPDPAPINPAQEKDNRKDNGDSNE